LNAAGEKLAKSPNYIDDASDNTALKLRAKVRRLKREQDLGLIIIDYLQQMKVHRPSERSDLDTSEITRSLKGLAKDLNLQVITLSQLTGSSKTVMTSARVWRTCGRAAPWNRMPTWSSLYIARRCSRTSGAKQRRQRP